MQTAAIAYRVADFLKQHPPFQFIDEPDLIALAARGRVRFHEPDEYVCWQSSPHTPFLYVIQQGSVSLWDESVDPPALRDIRGAGDCIGIERFNGSAISLHSAKTASEVVVYALLAADVEPLLARYPSAAQYVAAYSAVTAGYAAAAGENLHPHQVRLADLGEERATPCCSPGASIQEAASLLRNSGADALALTETIEGQPVITAILTPAELLTWIAAGAANPAQPVRNIAGPTVHTLSPRMPVSDCVLAMGEARATAAALTSDGSPSGVFQRVVTASSLLPAFGDQPTAILQEISHAATIESLRALNARGHAWILAHLDVPAALDWLASWADLLNRRIFERLLKLTSHLQSGDAGPLYCFYGAAGRREQLTAVAPRIAVIGGPCPDALETALDQCGYLSSAPPAAASLDEWKARFSGLVRDPVRNELYRSRPFFDLRPVQGPRHLFEELEAHVRAEMAAEPVFLRILANDCLSSLPPLTFFRDLVVEESGERTDTFRLESSTLQPLADVARVFGLASPDGGGVTCLGASTSERFEKAGRLLPERESIFREAAETMRVVLFHQARAGLRLGSSGDEIPLSALSRHDRQVLKSGFRSIHNLLEFTVPGDWLEDRL